MKYLLVYSLLISSLCAVAQQVSGRVTDENKNPMEGVNVFFDGSSIGTQTKKDGTFLLKVTTILPVPLVFRMMGYKSQQIANPFSNTTINIQLQPSNIQLNEIIVKKFPFTRAQMMAVFINQFLGTTTAGKKCKILNPDAIDFDFDFSQHRLLASASEPLKIENPYLGYLLYFDLQDFFVQFYSNKCNNDNVNASLYLGTSQFVLQNNSATIQKNRKKVFYGSANEFFKCMVNGSWSKKSFLLFDGSWMINPETCFEIIQTNDVYEVKIICKNNNTDPTFKRSFNILYQKKEQSRVTFLQEQFVVDVFGNTNLANKFEVSGAIASQRLGDLLPLDYSPTEKD